MTTQSNSSITPEESAALFEALMLDSQAVTQAGISLVRAEVNRLHSAELARLLELVQRGVLRLELRVSFVPVLSITAELVDDATGDLAGQLFQHIARPRATPQ